MPNSKPLLGHKIVTPPEFQLLRFNSLEAKERKPSKSATLKTRQGDGSLDTSEFSTQAFNCMTCARAKRTQTIEETGHGTAWIRTYRSIS